MCIVLYKYSIGRKVDNFFTIKKEQAMIRSRSPRQQWRKALLLVSFLLFPLTMNYLSPYVIVDGASMGIVNGSLIAFGLLFLSSLLVGRLWCGWLCPAGALAELCLPINDRPVNGKKIGWIKWAIWAPWLLLIAAMAAMAGGYRVIDPFLHTVGASRWRAPQTGPFSSPTSSTTA
jgi:hypothetical protein